MTKNKNSMKKLNFLKKTFLSLLCIVMVSAAHAQTDTSKVKTYVVITNDGGEFIGEIISQDAKEVLIARHDLAHLAVEQHVAAGLTRSFRPFQARLPRRLVR